MTHPSPFLSPRVEPQLLGWGMNGERVERAALEKGVSGVKKLETRVPWERRGPQSP